MKPSQFNIFFKEEDKMIGYNSYSNDFMILEQELYDLFIASTQEDVKELEEVHPEFYLYLKKSNFIVPKNTNEIQKVKDLVYSIDQANEESYHIIINPTMNCNFKCWYCYETHIKDSKMKDSEIEKVKIFISNILEKPKLKKLSISWFGGEPMLYFNKTVVPILEYSNNLCKNKNIKFQSNFTTNGLLIDNNLLDICVNNQVDFFQITLDGHRERHNKVRFVNEKRGSYDEIIQNIKLSLKYKIYVTVRLNISKETLDGDIEKIIDDFLNVSDEDRKFLNFSFHKVWQENIDLNLEIRNLIDQFKQNNFSTDYNKDIDSVRNSCYADKRNQATINYNGEVFKCTARDFKTKNSEGIITENGEILWNEKFEQRMNIKFKNTPCLECKILPICNGGCSQSALENFNKNQEYCVNDFDENKKIEIVREKFLSVIND